MFDDKRHLGLRQSISLIKISIFSAASLSHHKGKLKGHATEIIYKKLPLKDKVLVLLF